LKYLICITVLAVPFLSLEVLKVGKVNMVPFLQLFFRDNDKNIPLSN
jgi:hypothetical protein